jgi:hypothetical protein
MTNKLWCDLEIDSERVEFLLSGRACDTGIIAPVMVGEIVTLYRRIQAANDKADEIYRGGQDEKCDAAASVIAAMDEVVEEKWTYPSVVKEIP